MEPEELRKRMEAGVILTQSSSRQTKQSEWEEMWVLNPGADDEVEIDGDVVRAALKGVRLARQLQMHAKLARGGAILVYNWAIPKLDS